MDDNPHLLTLEDVEELTQLSDKVRRRMEEDGRFPKRIRFGHRTVRYRKVEIDRWIADPESYGEAA